MKELEELTGVTGVNDLHRDKIDHLTIPSRMGKGQLKRIDEVFDCWFESGRYVILPLTTVARGAHRLVVCHMLNNTIRLKTRRSLRAASRLTSYLRVLTRLEVRKLSLDSDL